MGFDIDIKPNVHEVDFLDDNFNRKKEYITHTENPIIKPLCIDTSSNEPPSIIKQRA